MTDTDTAKSRIDNFEKWIEGVKEEHGLDESSEPIRTARTCQPMIEKALEQESPLWVLPFNLRHPVLVRKPNMDTYRTYRNRVSEVWQSSESVPKKQEREHALTTNFALKCIAFPSLEVVERLANDNYDLLLQTADFLTLLARDSIRADQVKLKRP